MKQKTVDERARRERGAAAIEYAILLAAVAAVIVFAANQLGARTTEGLQALADLL